MTFSGTVVEGGVVSGDGVVTAVGVVGTVKAETGKWLWITNKQQQLQLFCLTKINKQENQNHYDNKSKARDTHVHVFTEVWQYIKYNMSYNKHFAIVIDIKGFSFKWKWLLYNILTLTGTHGYNCSESIRQTCNYLQRCSVLAKNCSKDNNDNNNNNYNETKFESYFFRFFFLMCFVQCVYTFSLFCNVLIISSIFEIVLYKSKLLSDMWYWGHKESYIK